MSDRRAKADAFRALHVGPPFLIPNPWDAGSARMLAAIGFRALATTSSGFAFTLGRLDGQATLEEVVAHAEAIDRATDLPVSVDLENGYGAEPEAAARAVTRVAQAGAAGASIEDFDRSGHLYDLPLAAERIEAAAESAHASDEPFMLTARAENHIRGHPDLDDTIARLVAYEAAGADVVYAPGLRATEEIRAVCAAVSAPVNVLALPGMTVSEIIETGAQRISVGGGLTWVAIDAAARAARELFDRGELSSFGGSPPLREWFDRSG
jgi:2-methylisocitrate lyase-like PEP mutase family enzyme